MGIWRTMPNGTRVFIEEGQDLSDAFRSNRELAAKTNIKTIVKNRDPSNINDALNELTDNSLKQHYKDGEISHDRLKLHDEIIESHFENAEPVKNPTFLMMGGGPAAGKSTVINSGQVKLPNKHVMVNSDDIKEKLPEYAEMISNKNPQAATYVHEESSFLTKDVMKLSMKNKYNTVLDGTGDGSVSGVMKKINQARKNGLGVEGVYVTCDTEVAVKRAVARGKETGRFVNEKVIRETHRKVSEILPEVADKFDRVKLYDTNGSGDPILIATGGGGQKLTPVKGQEKLFESFLAKAR